ncbi:MAG: sugar kinase, partial [Candidatus Aquicultor sp.]
MPEFDIISIGECLVELTSGTSLADTEVFRKAYGGDTITAIVAASRLGSRTGYITRVGEDHFAPFLLQGWLNERIDLSLVKVIPGFKNGVYFDAAFMGGGRELAYYREGSAASTLSVDDIKTEYIAAGKCLHVSGVSQAISETSRSAVYEACRLVKENRTGEVSYDPHYRSGLWEAEEARVAFHEVLPFVDILFLKHPFESEELTGITDPDLL